MSSATLMSQRAAANKKDTRQTSSIMTSGPTPCWFWHPTVMYFLEPWYKFATDRASLEARQWRFSQGEFCEPGPRVPWAPSCHSIYCTHTCLISISCCHLDCQRYHQDISWLAGLIHPTAQRLPHAKSSHSLFVHVAVMRCPSSSTVKSSPHRFIHFSVSSLISCPSSSTATTSAQWRTPVDSTEGFLLWLLLSAGTLQTESLPTESEC